MLGWLRRRMQGPPLLPPGPNGGGDAFRNPNAVPGLEAGAARRRLAMWQPAAVHVNALVQQAGATVNARARWLVRNHGYAKAALRSWTSATVGAGIKPSSLIEEQDVRKAVHSAWRHWTDEADAEEVTDFYGITRRVTREAFLAGECFIRMRRRFPQDGLSVPLQLQLLPSEQLPLWKREAVPADAPFNGGGAIRLGIEFDRNRRDRRVAYWFYRGNPTDPTLTFADALRSDQLVRVPADEIIHIYDPVEAGQLRGLTGYAAAIVKLFQLDAYDDAELERKKQIARHALFITVPAEHDDQGNPIVPDPGDDPLVLMPGIIARLLPGEDVKPSQPGDVGASYEPFQYRVLLQACAALGIPYAELSADLNKTTYASSRAGLLAFRQEVEAFQHAILVFQFLRRVWQQWLSAAVLAGTVPISAPAYNAQRGYWQAMKAITPKAAWVDPLKDRQAEVLALCAGTKAPQDVIEAEGADAEETLDRWAEWREMLKSRGLPEFDYGASTRGGAPFMASSSGGSGGTEPAQAEDEAA